MTPNESPKPQKFDYNAQLKEDFGKMIDSLEIKDLQKDYLRSRWLDQVLWMEGRAASMRDWHRRLRLGTIIISGILPIFLTFNFNKDATSENWLKVVTIGLSATATIAAASEEFFQFGDRWYSYRKSVELLKTQGWQFFQLSGSYRTYTDHSTAFPIFTEQVEEIIQRDVEVYTTEALKGGKRDEEDDPNPMLPPGTGS